MTPEQIDKEKAVKVEKTKTIQPNKADLEETTESIPELGKTKPVDKTPPKESDREYGKKVGDYRAIVKEAAKNGTNLDDVGAMPLADSDRSNIDKAIETIVPKELVGEFYGIANSHTAPKNEERNKLDQEALMKSKKMERKARWIDALSAFGSGLQGKDTKPDDFISTKLQRQRDEQFQSFKDTTERNQKTKYLWETQHRNELIDWAEKRRKETRDDAELSAKYQQIADQFKQNADYKNEQLKIARDRNNIARNKKAGSGGKDEKTVKIQTAQKTYELKPEEAAFYKGEILKNAATLRAKYPGWFTEGQKTDELTGNPTGEKTYKLNPEVKDVDMIRAYLENKEPGHLNEEAYEQNKAYYFDKYRKEKGLSTAPASNTAKPQAQKPKSQYSTGGLY